VITDLMAHPAIRDELTRRQLLRQAGIGGATLSASALLAACGGGGRPKGAPTSGGSSRQVERLTWLGGDVPSLDVAKESDYRAASIVTEPILTYDAQGNLIGHLARSWHQRDSVTYVYKVRQGVKFSDGTLLTPADIAYAINRHRDPKVASLLNGLYPAMDAIEVTGPDEVTVRLSQPHATWASIPTQILVAPKRLLEELGKDFGAPGKPIIGTGPYKVTDFAASAQVAYVANPHYWGKPPVAKQLTYQMLADPQTGALAMRSGEADGTFRVGNQGWEGIPNVIRLDVPSAVTFFASFDVTQPPYDDVHLRRAFAYALDRQGLINALYKGVGSHVNRSIVARSLWTNQLPKARVDALYAGLPAYEFNLDKARAELAQSAHPAGLDATIWFYNYDGPEKVALTWKDGLKQIGVNLKLEAVQDGVGADREDNHKDLGFHVVGAWPPDYPDPAYMPLTVLRSSEARKGHYNEANYKNPVVDRLLHENITATNPGRRGEALAKVMQIAAADMPYVPLWTNDQSMMIRDAYVYDDGSPHKFQPDFSIGLWTDHIRPV
jgi:peptide/nickel transport system substrate-binding protein